jgi:hypothetical protein
MPFAIIDRERDGDEAVVMVVYDPAFAEAIKRGLRRLDLQADVVPQAAGDGPSWLPASA